METLKIYAKKIKLALYLSVCIVFCVYFLSLSNRGIEESSLNYLNEMTLRNALSIESGLTYILERLSQSVRLVESDKELVNPNGEYNYKKMLVDLQATSVREHFDALRVAIIDVDGNAITSDNLNKNLAHRDFFRKSLSGELNVSKIINDAWSENEIIVFSSPIYYSGDIIGVATIALEIDVVSKLVGLDNATEHGFSYIKQDDGKMVISNFSSILTKTFKGIINSHVVFSNEITINGGKYYINSKKIKYNGWEVFTVLNDLSNKNIFKYLYGFAFASVLIIFLFLKYVIFPKLFYSDIDSKFNEVTSLPNLKLLSKDIMVNVNGFVVSFCLKNYDYLKVSITEQELNLLLVKAASVVNNTFLDCVKLFHNGKDDFIMLVNLENEQSLLYKLENINTAFCSQNTSLRLFFGIYKVEEKNEKLHEAIKKSIFVRDIYKFKTTGHFYRNYSKEELNAYLKMSKIEATMISAFDRKEFEFFVQPKICLKSNLVVGGEALVRWFYNGQYVLPSDFIPIFEKNGTISKLDLYIFERVCSYLASMIKFKPDFALPISVNLSRYYIFEPELVDCISSCLNKHSIPPELIEFEITETAFEQVKDYNVLSEIIAKLKDIGVKVSLDDFGEGYSSLRFFSTLHFDTIKFDREFFKNLKSRDIKVISSFVDTAHKLGMKVVAEGVETEAQLKILKKIDFDYVQGYIYSKPLPVEDYFNFLNIYNQKTING